MKLFILVNPGLEKIGQEEIKELLGAAAGVAATINPAVLEIEVKNQEEILKLIYGMQSVRRILIPLGKFKTITGYLKLASLNWADFFSSELSFKVEVENVKGQENREEIAKKIAGKVFTVLTNSKLVPKLEMKKPDILINVYFNNQEYFIGIDLIGVELNARGYRVFPHSASFKGDFAYAFIRKSGFKPENKLLVGFAKDGTLAIEAALYANQLPVHPSQEKRFSFFKFPFFSQVNFPIPVPALKPTVISAFDESQQNLIAARKNSQLAGTANHINFYKMALDELDVKFEPEEFDQLIFQITTKDEEKLNEIYYQANYVLKPKGTLLLIARPNWEISLSSKFKLVIKEEILRGGSTHKLWLLKKK